MMFYLKRGLEHSQQEDRLSLAAQLTQVPLSPLLSSLSLPLLSSHLPPPELSKNLPFAATVTMSDLGTFRLKGVEHTQQVFDMTPKDWVVRNFPKPTPALTGKRGERERERERERGEGTGEERERERGGRGRGRDVSTEGRRAGF